MRLIALPLALAALAAASAAHAQRTPDRFFVQYGQAERGTSAIAAGLTWEGSWKREWLGSEVSGTFDLMAARWRWRAVAGGHQTAALLAAVPMARLRPDQGRSPFFLEGGIGLSILDKPYLTPSKTFSTKWNFYDVLGAGYSFAERRHEVGVRLVHLSNGSAKKPNPGENFLELRYSMKF